MAIPVSDKNLFDDYNELKDAAHRLAKDGDIENSFKIIEGCAHLAYEFNFLERFSDDELEDLLISNAQRIVPERIEFIPNKNCVLFYDYFALNNRGLTQQYLTALIELDYEILFIISNDIFYNSGHDIINQLKSYSKSRIVIYSQTLSVSARISRLCKLIEEYKPAYTFLHLSPWDVIACSVFPLYASTKRFFINLTDHAYWLGKKSFDVCLEFRSYGFQLSQELRGIDEDKLVVLPYYPIAQGDDTYDGLPFNREGKVVGLSGGSGYKFIGDNWKLYHLVSSLLRKHDNFVFVLVGVTGEARAAYEEKVRIDKFQDRFIFLNNRYDIFQLIKHIDIYIGSYPFPGGLMTQLACLAKKPVVTFINHNFIFSYIEDIAPFRNKAFRSMDNEEEFITVASKLITDENYRTEFAQLTNDGVITADAFKSGLQDVLNNKKPFNYLINNALTLDDLSKVMSKWHLEIENTINHKYNFLLNGYFKLLNSKAISNKFSGRYKLHVNGASINAKHKFKSALGKISHTGKRIIGNLGTKTVGFNQLKFKSLGKNAIVEGDFLVINPGYISLGKNFFSLNNLRIEARDEHLGERFYPELTIGNNVIFNTDCHIGCINKVVIGHNVLLASRIYISDHSHGEITKEALRLPPAQRSLISKGPVIIEDNVWVGEGVCILPGVTIGANSIIGANAVVTKPVPPNSVVAGLPARVIKQLE